MHRRVEAEAAVADNKLQKTGIASLLPVIWLFTQSCRIEVYSMKDLLLTQEQINTFDRAVHAKRIMEEKKKKNRQPEGSGEKKITTRMPQPALFLGYALFLRVRSR